MEEEMKKKITLVRVGVGKEDTFIPSPMDLEYWRACFEHTKNIDPQKMQEQGVNIQTFELEENFVLCVKLGGVNGVPLNPSKEDLEDWKQIFEEAQGDPDFKIFTCSNVELKQIPIGKTTMIISSGDVVVVGQDGSSVKGAIC